MSGAASEPGLTLHCISFFVIIQVSLVFPRGGVLFFWEGTSDFFSQIMKGGNFASAPCIAAGVWFSYSDHVGYI